jgi:hypothetical protein
MSCEKVRMPSRYLHMLKSDERDSQNAAAGLDSFSVYMHTTPHEVHTHI